MKSMNQPSAPIMDMHHPMTPMGPPMVPMKNMQNFPTLYVGDIDEQITEEALYLHFNRFGQIFSIRIMRDRYLQRRSRGFAFISFYNPKDAEAARINANHDILMKKPIRVTWKKHPSEMDKNANIFICQIPDKVTIKEIDGFFSRFGSIFSSKISYNEEGKSLGYGYVQFDKEEFAKETLKNAEGETDKYIKISNEHKIKVCEFVPFKQRKQNVGNNNLYVKHLPEESEETVTIKLKELFSKYGELSSVIVKKDNNREKLYGFVCFVEAENAVKAVAALNGTDAFENQNPLYVTVAEKKEARLKKMKEIMINAFNEVNLYTKNLLKSVTADQLKTIFSVFGEVTSVRVNIPPPAPQIPGKHYPEEKQSNYGYICFKEKEKCKEALRDAFKNEDVLSLYVDKNCYLTYHVNKEQYKMFKDIMGRTKRKYNFPPGMAGMGYAYPPGMFPPPPHGFMMDPYLAHMNMPPMYPPHMMHPPAPGHPHSFSMPPHVRKPYFNQKRQYPQQPYNGRKPYQNNRYDKHQPAPERKDHSQHHNPHQNHPPAPLNTDQGLTPQMLKNRIAEFMKLDQEKQRTILGEMLFPLIEKVVDKKDSAPKVTGMLIDFTVFEVADILEFLENQEILKERVKEAEELMNSSGN